MAAYDDQQNRDRLRRHAEDLRRPGQFFVVGTDWTPHDPLTHGVITIPHYRDASASADEKFLRSIGIQP